MDLIIKFLSECFYVDVVCVDFLKASDMVSHSRLIQKLWDNGIKDKLLKLIQFLLSERHKIVVLGDVVLSWLAVKSRVHQGSVL